MTLASHQRVSLILEPQPAVPVLVAVGYRRQKDLAINDSSVSHLQIWFRVIKGIHLTFVVDNDMISLKGLPNNTNKTMTRPNG